MTPSISINDFSFAQISGQAIGMHGVEVEDSQHAGTKFVLMSVEGYEQLRRLAYDDSDLSEQEMLAAAGHSLEVGDADDWNSDGMEEYDACDGTAPAP